MRIRDILNPFSLQLCDDTALPVNVMGIPIQSFHLMIEDAHHQQRRGNGKFVITNAAMGQMLYHFSEEELSHSDDTVKSLRVERVEGDTLVIEFNDENRFFYLEMTSRRQRYKTRFYISRCEASDVLT